MYCVTPGFIAMNLREAMLIINNAVEDAFLLFEDSQFVNVPEFFFVSTKLARHFPYLFESSMILAHQTACLRHFSQRWKWYLGTCWKVQWPTDWDRAGQMFYRVFCTYTASSAMYQIVLAIGTLPLKFQRGCARVFQLLLAACGCAIYYYRMDIPFWAYILAGIVVGHDVLAWLCRWDERKHTSTVNPSTQRRQKNTKPKPPPIDVIASATKAKKSPSPTGTPRVKGRHPATLVSPRGAEGTVTPYKEEYDRPSRVSPSDTIASPGSGKPVSPTKSSVDGGVSPYAKPSGGRGGLVLPPLNTGGSSDSDAIERQHAVRRSEHTPSKPVVAYHVDAESASPTAPKAERTISNKAIKLPPLKPANVLSPPEPNVFRQLKFDSSVAPRSSPEGNQDSETPLVAPTSHPGMVTSEEAKRGESPDAGVSPLGVESVPDGSNSHEEELAHDDGHLQQGVARHDTDSGRDSQHDDKDLGMSEASDSDRPQAKATAALGNRSDELSEAEQADAVYMAINKCLRTLRSSPRDGGDSMSHMSSQSDHDLDDMMLGDDDLVPSVVAAYSDTDSLNEAIDDCLYLDDAGNNHVEGDGEAGGVPLPEGSEQT